MRFFSYLLVAAIAFIAAMYLSGTDILPSDGQDIDFSDKNAVSTEPQEPTPYTTYYSQLTDFQKNIYNALLGTVSTAGDKLTLSNIDVESFKREISDIGSALQYDHPEYFWYTGGYSYSYPRFADSGTVTVEPIYYDYVSAFFNAKGKTEALQQRVREVAALAGAHSADDYERILFVHDYLIENAVYDHDALEEYYKATRSPSCEYIFSAYGCLVDGKTVCSGYAKAFQLIMYELGYDCSYVVGDAGEAHGWNCVYLNGNGYFVDVTWDDADFEKEVPLYDYAFITGKELAITHTIEMPFETPVCTATDLNFFKKHGYYTDSYNFLAVADILSKQKDNDCAYICFGSGAALGEALTDLFENGRINKIDGMKNAARYSYNDDRYTIAVQIDS